jgi:hypothetical protein
MACNSRAKGARGERFIAAWIRGVLGFDARRGQQYCGASGDADVVGIPGIHIESKFVQALNIDRAMEQSVRDAGINIPTVWHKKNRGELMITIRANDLIRFAKAIIPS